jgi:hypothetical protein
MMENNQNLIAIYAQLLHRTTIDINTRNIPWITNIMADFLSCLDLSHLVFVSCTEFSAVQLSAELALFPAELHVLTTSHLVTLQHNVAGPTHSASKGQTFRKCVLHHFCFVVNMKWMDDLTGATLPRCHLSLQLTLYAMHLGNGGSLLCCMIKAGTNAKYLQAVENFLQHLHPM